MRYKYDVIIFDTSGFYASYRVIKENVEFILEKEKSLLFRDPK